MVFKLTASLKDLERIRDFIGQRSLALGLDPDITYDLQLAVVELVTNSVVHGYQGQPGYVEIQMDNNGDKLLVYVRDQAARFDPTRVPPPDMSVSLEERRFGGMGVFLTKQLVDEMKYRPLPQGGNEVTLVIANKPK